MSVSLVRNLVVKRVCRRVAAVQKGGRELATREDRNVLTYGFPDEEFPKISVNECLFEHAHKWSDKIATECAFTGRKYTYDDVRKKSKNFSKALRKKLKLNKGDIIASLLPNIPEYPIVILGALRAGLVVTTINPLYTADEISKQLVDSGAKVLVTTSELWKSANSASKLSNRTIPIITIRTENTDTTPQGAIKFSEFADSEYHIDDLPYANADDLAFLPYSSGTTGLPKGVELTHFNVVCNILQSNHPKGRICFDTTENHQDVIPVILPMFHIYGLNGITHQSMRNGSKMVTLPKFAPDSYIKMLQEYKPHILYLAPPLVLFLTMHPDVKPQHLDRVRTVVSGAAPLGASDEKNFLEKANAPIDILQGYGLTETSPVACMLTAHIKKEFNCYGSIGKPVVNTRVKIVPADDSSGAALGPGEQGELLIKGPQVMKGYHNRPEENEKAFVDGWLRSGDMGYFDENGLIYVTDRLKELIKVKGFQVPPAELEALIRSFPGVSDAAVIGVPHPLYGEVPKAYVVPKLGKSVDTERLQEFVKEKVAHFKQLKGGVSVVESIPKNAAGKILRRLLKEEYQRQEQVN